VVLTVSFALSLVTGLCCHHRLQDHRLDKLDISVGISGPHDFAVCGGVFVRRDTIAPGATHIHRIPRPTCRDDRDTPLLGARDGASSRIDLPGGERENFLRKGLDSGDMKRAADLPDGQVPARWSGADLRCGL
jgi:hypothetical protein